MKKIKSLFAIGASLFFLTASGCMTNSENNQQIGGKAELTDYLGISKEINYNEQVKAYDNYVEIDQLTHKSVNRVTQYADYNKDNNVDVYSVEDWGKERTSGKIIVIIASKPVWEKNSFHNTIVKYADKELQEIVNKDYELLRQKGVRKSGELFSSIKVD